MEVPNLIPDFSILHKVVGKLEDTDIVNHQYLVIVEILPFMEGYGCIRR